MGTVRTGAVKLSAAQRTSLEAHARGGSGGESWAQYDSGGRYPVALAWHNHERMLDSFARRGWIDEKGDITPAGRAVLGST